MFSAPLVASAPEVPEETGGEPHESCQNLGGGGRLAELGRSASLRSVYLLHGGGQVGIRN